MASKPGRLKKIDLGDTAWVVLLSRCIDSLDSEDFPECLVAALKSITDFDY